MYHFSHPNSTFYAKDTSASSSRLKIQEADLWYPPKSKYSETPPVSRLHVRVQIKNNFSTHLISN
jgi:hypothetical protein